MRRMEPNFVGLACPPCLNHSELAVLGRESLGICFDDVAERVNMLQQQLALCDSFDFFEYRCLRSIETVNGLSRLDILEGLVAFLKRVAAFASLPTLLQNSALLASNNILFDFFCAAFAFVLGISV